METIKLREKWQKSISKVDDRFIRMIDALYKSYTSEEDIYDDLPEEAKHLIDQGLKDIEEGRIHSHENVLAEFKEKYNIS
jgi:predicted transcriptional regulator